MNDATPLSELRLTLDFSQISTIIARAIRTDHHKEADPGYGVAEGQASARNLIEALRAAQPVDPPASEEELAATKAAMRRDSRSAGEIHSEERLAVARKLWAEASSARMNAARQLADYMVGELRNETQNIAVTPAETVNQLAQYRAAIDTQGAAYKRGHRRRRPLVPGLI